MIGRLSSGSATVSRARHSSAVRLGWLLFIIAAIVFLCTSALNTGYDGGMMLRVAQSLVLHHSFQVVDPVYHVQQPYSSYGIGVSLLLVPFVAVGWLLSHDGSRLIILYDPLVTAATVVALNRLLVELGVSWRRSLALALVFAFATLAWHYSSQLFSEPLVGLSLTVSLLAALRFRRTGQRWCLVAAGAALAVAILARPDSAALVALPLAGYALVIVFQRRPPIRTGILDLVAFGASPVLALAADLLYNIYRYGNPLSTGYENQLGFSFPFAQGIYGLLLSPGAGLLVFVPLLALGILGVRRLAAAWPAEALLILVLLVIRVLFYARWWAWDGGGGSWGPRFLLPLIPLLIIPLAFLPDWRALRAVAVGFVALSLGIEVLGQLVPYNVEYNAVAAQLAPALHLSACTDCGVASMVSVELTKYVMDFDWRYAPLVGQARLLVEGQWAPVWLLNLSRVVIIPFALYALIRGLPDLWRTATRLDAAGSNDGGAPLGRAA